MHGPIATLLEESFEHFRRCGAGRRECVVFWTGPLQEPMIVDAVLHPAHTSGRAGYEISVPWLKGLWLELYEQGRTVRVQVHTHPRIAFHSATDDAFPISQRTGFLSLVVPNFGAGDVTLAGTALFELGHNGDWSQRDPGMALSEAA